MAGLVVIAAIGAGVQLGQIDFKFDMSTYAVNPYSWILAAICSAFYVGLIVVPLGRLYTAFTDSIVALNKRSSELRLTNEQLKDEIIDLKPDCIAYMQQGYNLDDICKLLASGANIVTTCLKFHHPDHLDPTDRERIEEACRRGNTSIYCSGISPGFITEVLPLSLLSIMRRLDCLSINEYADMSQYPHPVMLFDIMGYGLPPDQFLEFKDHVLGHFGSSLSLLFDSIAMPIDSFEVSEDVATVRKKTQIVAGTIEAGTIGARRITITGIRKGRKVLRFRPTWYVDTDVDASWDFRESGWHFLAEGDPPFDVSIRFPIPPEDYEKVTPGLTAYGPVNTIPFVCEAPCGIRTTMDLPHIVPYLG